MRHGFAILVLAALGAAASFAEDPPPAPAPPVRKKAPEPRKFEKETLSDPYWGATYSTPGLEEKPGPKQPGRLLDAKAGRVQIDIGIWEYADTLSAKERRDAVVKGWDERNRQHKDRVAGDDPTPWVTYEEASPSGSMRRHGHAWFVRGCRAFVVHAHIAADAEGGADAVRAALFGLVLGPETGAAVAVQAVSMANEMPYDDPGVLAAAAQQYLGATPNSPPRPAIAEGLLRRAVENLPGSPLERSPPGVKDLYEKLTMALILVKKYDEAIAAGLKSVELAGKTMSPGPDIANARYNLACAYSLAGKLDDAFAQLELAFARFPPVPDDHLTKDEDLANCRADARWAKFMSGKPTKK